MNRRMIFYMLGRIIRLEAFLMLLPCAVSFWYRESCAFSFLIAIGIALVLGFALMLCARPKDQVIYAKEGFLIVALTWLALSAIGALPFVLSGEIPSYVDAFFETVSGFSTTGASILNNVEALSHGILFWRSFTHWIGGMGVLVLMMALVPNESGRSIHILRAEMPGPVVGKLVPRIRDTAKILYMIYIVLTLLEMLFLMFGGMSLFEASLHAFGTAGTGGFGIRGDSIASYSPYLQWVITVFMLLFGVNFNLYYLLLLKRVRPVFRSEELWCYFGIIAASTAAIAVNIYSIYQNISVTVRQSAFQVVSLLTTTGYGTASINDWPGFSKALLFLLMFLGGCAGSTAGGLKLSRAILLIKTIRRDFRHLLHPHSVGVVRFEEKRVDDETLTGVSSYFAIYCLIMAVVFLLLSAFDPFSFETNITATVSCFNNIGPAYGQAAASYSVYSAPGTLLLSVAMLLGRLEIYPLLILLVPAAWRRK